VGIFSHAELKSRRRHRYFQQHHRTARTPRIVPSKSTARTRGLPPLVNKYFGPLPIKATEAAVRPIAVEIIVP